ncbi:MAG: diguanylate cyclase [Acidobacteria bacterium]|nr:diguanylate cyclase [Acidobacteriota bacterium]
MNETLEMAAGALSGLGGLDRETLLRVLEHLREGVYFVDTERVIRYWNRGAERLTGYRAEDVVGQPCGAVLLHVGETGQVMCGGQCPLLDCVERRCEAEGRMWLKHEMGHRVPVMISAVPVLDAQGRALGMLEVFRDATEELALLERATELERLALLDGLTGAGNRRFAERVLEQSWEAWKRYRWKFGVALLDVDHFKALNDRYGHGAGDAVLRAMSRTMVGGLRSFDFLGRWGGEEFLLVVQSVGREDLLRVAGRCRELVSSLEVPWGGQALTATVSGGVVGVEEVETLGELVELADARLYCAKEAGRNRLIGRGVVEIGPCLALGGLAEDCA